VPMVFNGKQEILSNAVDKYVAVCLHFLSGDTDQIRIEVEVPHAVSSDAINDYV